MKEVLETRSKEFSLYLHNFRNLKSPFCPLSADRLTPMIFPEEEEEFLKRERMGTCDALWLCTPFTTRHRHTHSQRRRTGERGEEGEWDEWEGGGRTKKKGTHVSSSPPFSLFSLISRYQGISYYQVKTQ
jgi:hypothetical protein